MAKRPLFAMGLFAFFAALVCTQVPFSGIVAVVIASAATLLIAIVLRKVTSIKSVALCALGALVASGAFLVKECAAVYPQLALDGTTTSVTMQVREILPSGQGYLVRVVDGGLEPKTGLCVYTYRRDLAPQSGDVLEATVRLEAAFDNADFDDASFAKSRGVYLYATIVSGEAFEWRAAGEELSWVDRTLFSLRSTIHDALYRCMPFDEAALAEGVLLGYRRNIDGDTAWAYRVSGVYHLLAVSGQHLSMLVGILFWLFDCYRIRHRKGAAIGMVIALAFTALCGFSPSVTRACVMTFLVLSGCLFRRRPEGLNSVGGAAFVMIAVDPFVIYDIGFQLSIVSTLGIVMLFPIWQRDVVERVTHLPPKIAVPVKAVLAAVGLSLSATLLTQPFTALYFGELSVWFLIGNVICVPLSSILLVLCLVFALAYVACMPIACVIADVMTMIAQAMTAVTRFVASLPFASVCVKEPFLIVWVFALALAVIVSFAIMKWRGVRRAVVGMTAVLLLVLPVARWMNADVTTIIPVSSSSPTWVIETADSRGMIFKGDGGTLERAVATMRSEGITRLDWVLWLNEASWRSVDLTALTIPIERLIVVDEAEDYVSLPSAQTVTLLGTTDVIRFGEN
ncbi:MAG: ComEC/Rec2 family competence protein, partial [Clostridia bacterium]|nr:ComEC/Rec2 family competence protein [Clostridia bacterium]